MSTNNKSQFEIYLNDQQIKSFENTHSGSPTKEFLNHLTNLKDELNLRLTEIIDAEKNAQNNGDKNPAKLIEKDEDAVLEGNKSELYLIFLIIN